MGRKVCSQKDLEGFLSFAIRLARKAGAIQMKYLRQVEAEWTSAHHFRTKADLEIADLVRDEIGKRFPDHRIYSEELPAKKTGSKFMWVADELDGTGPYTLGLTDHFSFCLSLVCCKTPLLGVIFAPKRREMYAGIIGQGSFCNGKPIRVNSLAEIGKAWIGGDPGKFNRTAYIPYIKRAMQDDGISCFVQSGCASVPLALVASGRLNAYFATSLNPEDMCAAVAILRSAGAKVTNLEGAEWKFGDPSILAANPRLHKNLSKFFGIPY